MFPIQWATMQLITINMQCRFITIQYIRIRMSHTVTVARKSLAKRGFTAASLTGLAALLWCSRWLSGLEKLEDFLCLFLQLAEVHHVGTVCSVTQLTCSVTLVGFSFFSSSTLLNPKCCCTLEQVEFVFQSFLMPCASVSWRHGPVSNLRRL